MNATQARQLWRAARHELEAIQMAVRQLKLEYRAPAPLLAPLLPEAQRRVDEAYGTMMRLQSEEDERRWQGMMERTRGFVPPDDNPLWTMDLCAAPVVKRRGRPPKARGAVQP